MTHNAPRARETATTACNTSTEPTSPWMDERGAAGRLGVSVNTITNWRRQGLPHVKLGRVVRIHRDRLDEWFATYDATRGGDIEAIVSAAIGFRDGVKADGTPYRGGDLTNALREAGL